MSGDEAVQWVKRRRMQERKVDVEKTQFQPELPIQESGKDAVLPAGGNEPCVLHCLTFDIEEHFQVAAFDSPMRRRHWERFESRVEQNTYKIMALLSNRGVRATFFVLGWIAERHPGLIRELAEEGHEIGSHGYAHETINSQSPRTFREDVRKAKRVLEDVIGRQVIGYRAPNFSVSWETRWVIPILVEEGFQYDSSIFPIVHDQYGWPGADPYWHRMETSSGNIWEIPPSTVDMGAFRVPIAGGGYLRLIPYSVLRGLMRRAAKEGHPLVIYLHPWELDPQQPRMNGSFKARFRHYVNLHKTERKLVSLLEDFRFGSIVQVMKNHGDKWASDGCLLGADAKTEQAPTEL